MTSITTDLATNAASTQRRTRAALYLTTAIAAAIPVATQASTAPGVVAGTVTTVTVSTTAPTPDTPGTLIAPAAGTINNATGGTLTADQTIIVNSAVITGGGSTIFGGSYAASVVGVVNFTNNSTIGVLANPVGPILADNVGVSLFGAGPAATTNTATVNNSGLITGVLAVTNFGGNVTIANTGTGAINGGNVAGTPIQATTAGNVVYTQGATATVGGTAGNSVILSSNAKSTVAGNVTTFTQGNVTATVNGALGTTAARVGLQTNAATQARAGTSTIAVNGVAGTVSGNAFGLGASKTESVAAIAGFPGGPVAFNLAGVTASQTDTYASTATSVVTIGATGDVSGVTSAAGTGGSTVVVTGKVGAGGVFGNTNFVEATDNFSKSVISSDGAGAITSRVDTASVTQKGGASLITIDATGSVGGNITSFSDTLSNVIVNGAVAGAINSDARGGKNTTSTTTVVPAAPVNSSSTEAFNASAAAVTIGATGVVGTTAAGSNVTVSSYSNSSFNNAGKVFSSAAGTGNVTVTANGGALANTNSTVGTATSTTVASTSTVNAGGQASFTNAVGAYVGGDVNVNGPTGATVTNLGQVARTTQVNAEQQFNQSTVVNSAVTTGATTVTTATTNTSSSVAGGSIAGTYAGVNGEANFVPIVGQTVGTISQFAHKASSATVSGTVYGNVNSNAGTGTNQTVANSTVTTFTTDGVLLTPTGTNVIATRNSTTNSSANGGASSVTVTGLVSNVLGGGTVNSTGTDSSTVNVSGTVMGSVTSSANGVNVAVTKNDLDVTQVFTKVAAPGVTTSAVSTDTTTNGYAAGLGASTVNITGKGSVGGSVTVSGVTSSTATVDAGAKITGGLAVSSALVSDTSTVTSKNYAYDPATKVATHTLVSTVSTAPTATSGASTATVAGTVGGTVSTNSSRGNATTTINGQITAGNATSNTNGSGTVTKTEVTTTASNSAGDARVVADPALGTTTKNVVTTTVTATGGKALTTVDTSAAFKATGVGAATVAPFSVSGNATSSGLAGATTAITAGSSVGGVANATSLGTNSVTVATATPGTPKSTSLTVATTTQAGTTAAVTNDGIVASNSTATGTTAASVTNSATGRILGSVLANSQTVNTTVTTTDNDTGNSDPSTRTQVATTVTTGNAGVATVTNAGRIGGSANITGGGAVASTLTNTGTIVGVIQAGAVVADQTQVTTTTAGATTVAPATSAGTFAQNYTINQNSLAGGGINVSGVNNGTLKTSTINATVNLNGGSTTLGTIQGQQSSAFANLTNTNVNLTGAGYLGLDFLATPTATATGPNRSPEAVLSATQAGDLVLFAGAQGTAQGARVLGANSITKTGAGTFVITGTAFNATAGLGVNPWTIDLGGVSTATTNVFNINAGEVQLAIAGQGATSTFGIKGDINNAATLVLGRREVPAAPATNLTAINLVTAPEVIRGITVNETGNFTQTAAGTLVVGFVPSLQGTAQAAGVSGSGTTILAPTVGSVSVSTFSPSSALACGTGTAATPANCSVNSASRINVTGNINLAGKVAIDANENSLFSNGDTAIIASYTGTGVSTAATVASNLVSPYVTFALVNDTTAKTISLTAARAGYATTAGLNVNSKNAAAGLDSALTAAIATIKGTATPGSTAGAATVTAWGNAQDVAKVAAALDWRLTAAQASEVFAELSSAEIYSSLAALDQNAGFGQSLDILSERRSAGSSRGAMSLGAGEGIGARLWLNPTARFAKYGVSGSGTEGQSQLRANSFGGAMGLDLSFSDTGAFGFGVGYAKHDMNDVGTPESADGDTVTVGAYVTQGFGPIYANLKLAYGFSKFNVVRNLLTSGGTTLGNGALLGRTMAAQFKGNQFDAALQVGYDMVSGSATITPFAELAVRHWKLNGFTETGGAGLGVSSGDASKSVFNPTIGVKFAANTGDADGFSLRPFGKLAYTFQGNIGNERQYTYAAGGSPFSLFGVNPKGHGTAELGIDATINNSVGLWLGGSYEFGGNNKVGSIRAGLDFMFGGGRHVEAAPLPMAPAPMAPAPVVEAPAPAAPVCNKGPYIVFFDWDKSDVTAEASTILDSAVSAYGNCSRVPVMVAGYADRSGSPGYNQGLSERRAANVRGYLTSHGVSDSAISTQGFGENNNRVPTADGVKELQNRRVEISYGPGSGN